MKQIIADKHDVKTAKFCKNRIPWYQDIVHTLFVLESRGPLYLPFYQVLTNNRPWQQQGEKRSSHVYFVLISGVGSMPILAKHVFFVLRLRVKHAEKAHPVHMKRSSLSSLQYLCCPSCFDTPCACQSKIRLYLPLKWDWCLSLFIVKPEIISLPLLNIGSVQRPEACHVVLISHHSSSCKVTTTVSSRFGLEAVLYIVLYILKWDSMSGLARVVSGHTSVIIPPDVIFMFGSCTGGKEGYFPKCLLLISAGEKSRLWRECGVTCQSKPAETWWVSQCRGSWDQLAVHWNSSDIGTWLCA